MAASIHALRSHLQGQPAATEAAAPQSACKPQRVPEASLQEQLRLLHAENLNLNVLVKQERAAREHWQSQHAAITSLLRCAGRGPARSAGGADHIACGFWDAIAAMPDALLCHTHAGTGHGCMVLATSTPRQGRTRGPPTTK
jgi:hypothetical protein